MSTDRWPTTRQSHPGRRWCDWAARLALVILAGGIGAPPVSAQRQPTPPAEERRTEELARVRTWGYQLRLINPDTVAASAHDLVVLDHAISANRRFVREYTPGEVAQMRRKPDGARRIVLSYLSIGEAERYRFYWKPDWYVPELKPDWLGDLNPQWDGNYIVRFWSPEWQALIFGQPGAYLERVIEQGFDGVYLDRADVFLEWQKLMPNADRLMMEFIQRLAAHARKLKPGFIVVMQNAEELLADRGLRQTLDGIAKEDLMFGIEHSEQANEPGTVDWALNDLRRAKRAGRAVFVVEYLADPAKIEAARKRMAAEGIPLHVTSRDLGRLEPPRP